VRKLIDFSFMSGSRTPDSREWDVSVSICTYNRCSLLRQALDSVVSQAIDHGQRYEVIVVDNNSTDDTKRLVHSYIAQGHTNLRYLFEGRQGLSYAREAAIAHARAPIIAFTDDDVRVAPDWVSSIKRAFDSHAEVAWVGGKVLPHWPAVLPRWMSREHWAPLAILDFGDQPFHVTASQPRCLVGANLAFRKDVLDGMKRFEPSLQRVKDSIGSMEDHELLMRLLKVDRQGLYAPDVVVTSDIPASRLSKEYHRRWHHGHGHFYAIGRFEDLEHSNTGRLFGVPAHMYRQAAIDALRWLQTIVRGDLNAAFTYELRLMFFAGFVQTRYKDFSEVRTGNRLAELGRFARSLARRFLVRGFAGHSGGNQQ
jgi:glycosyltransferase involved in cell wall biosynthesis